MDGPALFRACRDALGLTAAGLAARLHVVARTVRKWEAGDRAVPGPVWVALRFMLSAPRQRLLARAITALLDRDRGSPGLNPGPGQAA